MNEMLQGRRSSFKSSKTGRGGTSGGGDGGGARGGGSGGGGGARKKRRSVSPPGVRFKLKAEAVDAMKQVRRAWACVWEGEKGVNERMTGKKEGESNRHVKKRKGHFHLFI